MKYFWVECEECKDSYVAAFFAEFGLLVASDSIGETCECGGPVEIGDEWEGSCD